MSRFTALLLAVSFDAPVAAQAQSESDVIGYAGLVTTPVGAFTPVIGVGIPTEGGGSVVTAGLSLPLSASINAGTQLRVVPFVSPGFVVS